MGLITSNALMKGEFGKKLVETFLPKADLPHVIDVPGAYIPGHATPTTILYGRHRKPLSSKVRVVRGTRAELKEPQDPAEAPVWLAIVQQVDKAGSESSYVSVADAERNSFGRHPWSIGG